MSKFVCSMCGSGDVFQDAAVSVNDPDVVVTFDGVTCEGCGTLDVHVLEVADDPEPTCDYCNVGQYHSEDMEWDGETGCHVACQSADETAGV